MKKISLLIFLFLLAVAIEAQAAQNNTPVANNPVVPMCTDGEDADVNTELQDNSIPFIVNPFIPENTLFMCSDSYDNDGNGLPDLEDPNCASFIPDMEGEEYSTICSDGENDPSNREGNNENAGVVNIPIQNNTQTSVTSVTPPVPTPSTISPQTTTTVGPLTSGTTISSTFIEPAICPDAKMVISNNVKYGKNDNKKAIVRLQAFLNKNLKLRLTINGTFDFATRNAAKMYQIKNKKAVLSWNQPGLIIDLVPTKSGIVSKTSKSRVNVLQCPTWDIIMPIIR